MRNISITDGENTVTFLPDLKFTITPTFVGESANMANGRTVIDYVGVKNKLEIPTGWLSSENLALLKRMIYQHHILTVSYPDVDGDKSALFVVDPPVFKSFKYGENGVEQWYGVTLTMTEYEVSS